MTYLRTLLAAFIAASILVAVPVPAQTAAEPAGRTFQIEVPAIKPEACQGSIALTYQQRNTIARVTGAIKNPTCAASSGNYELTINVEDADGKRQALNVTETWERSDAADVQFTTDYEIGENVDLVNVRTRRIRCECAEIPAAQ